MKLGERKDTSNLAPATRRRLPVRFDERHEIAYQFYFDLGPSRNFQKVAAHFKISRDTVANWSLAYGWRDRLHQDIEGKNEQGLISYFSKIAAVRNNGIDIVHDIMGILRESLDIINKAREEKRPLNDEEQKGVSAKQGYLEAIGFKVHTGKDLRDLINALGEILEFKPGGGGGNGSASKGSQPINVTGGSVLILQGLSKDEAKEVLHDDRQVQGLQGSNQHNPA